MGNTGPGGGHNAPTDSPVTFTGSACPADFDNDRDVSAADLALLLSDWASGGGNTDINRDGIVDASDLAGLLAAWGACN